MKTALILAAGRGERLKPLTDNIPKALCAVHHIPLIEHHVIRLARAGFERAIINHAHLGDQIKRHLGCGVRFGLEIIYLPEPPGAFETGGAVVNALPYLGEQPFVTLSADIFTDYDFSTLRRPNKNAAHLVLIQPHPAHPMGDFGLSSTHHVTNTPRTYVFSNIACFDPRLFREYSLGRYAMAPLLRQGADNGQVTGDVYHGVWFNIGTLERLTRARACADHRL